MYVISAHYNIKHIYHSQLNNMNFIEIVYMLWKFPTLIPGLTTWNPVVDKLRNGADLMIPGVITSNAEIPEIEEGSLVVIRARGNRYPLAIGTMAVSGRVLASSRGTIPPKGKAVHVLHVHEDQLWIMGNKQSLPSDWASGPKPLLGDEYESTDDEDDDAADEQEQDDVQELADSLEAGAVVDVKGKGRAELNDTPVTEACERIELTIEVPAPIEAEAIAVLSTAEVDQALSEALLQVLKFKITEANSKELLPMNASTLYSSYVLPNRSCGRAAEADIKKSSWKKLAKWLKAVEKQDQIKCKEIKGELFLLGVSWNHPQYVKVLKG